MIYILSDVKSTVIFLMPNSSGVTGESGDNELLGREFSKRRLLRVVYTSC
jgi:hypothetical protein